MRARRPRPAGPARRSRRWLSSRSSTAPRSAKRAEPVSGAGMPAREAELARGFVLGEDERVDPARSKTSAAPASATCWPSRERTSSCWRCWRCRCSAALGIPLRERLVWVLALIAVYVPLAGAGPTIQRAAVMGAAGLLATLAGRRASRLYALGAGAGGDARDRSGRSRRRRLAAQLRGGGRDLPARRAVARGDRREDRLEAAGATRLPRAPR